MRYLIFSLCLTVIAACSGSSPDTEQVEAVETATLDVSGTIVLTHLDRDHRVHTTSINELNLQTGQVKLLADAREASQQNAGGPIAVTQRCRAGIEHRLLLVRANGNLREMSPCGGAHSAVRMQHPAISYDGNRLAVQVTSFANDEPFKKPSGGVIVFDSTGNEIARLRGYATPEFLPSGALLMSGGGAYQGPGFGLYRTNKSLTQIEQIDSGELDGEVASLSTGRRGETAVFLFNLQIWEMNLKSRKLTRRLVPDKEILAVDVSPDGEKIAFVIRNDLQQKLNDADRTHRLHILDSDSVIAVPISFPAAGPLNWVE